VSGTERSAPPCAETAERLGRADAERPALGVARDLGDGRDRGVVLDLAERREGRALHALVGVGEGVDDGSLRRGLGAAREELDGAGADLDVGVALERDEAGDDGRGEGLDDRLDVLAFSRRAPRVVHEGREAERPSLLARRASATTRARSGEVETAATAALRMAGPMITRACARSTGRKDPARGR
jgi:hypothetical protein